MSDIEEKSTHVSSLHQALKSRGHVIKQAHWVSEKVHWANDGGRLAS